MDKRLAKFNELSTHSWLGRAFGKLTAQELAQAREFIVANAHLDKGAFEYAVNRMYMDKPKPKHWTMVVELLTAANV